MKNINQTCANLLNSIAFNIRRKVKDDRLHGRHVHPHADEALALIEALKTGRFKFKPEAWHNVGDLQTELPAEMLLRAHKENLQKISPQDPIAFINAHGEHAAFDQAIILLSVAQALNQNRHYISINTSARNISDKQFWLDTKDLLQNHFEDDALKNIRLVFEITEDSLAKDPCREVLLKMKDELNCAFAIDDSYHDRKGSRDDVRRLLHLAARRGYNENDSEGRQTRRLERGLVDFVKIDGGVIRDAFESLGKGDDIEVVKREIQNVTDEIRSLFPGAMIIAEKVQSETEKAFLRDHTAINAVQGHMLSEPDEDPSLQMMAAKNKFPGTQPG